MSEWVVHWENSLTRNFCSLCILSPTCNLSPYLAFALSAFLAISDNLAILPYPLPLPRFSAECVHGQ